MVSLRHQLSVSLPTGPLGIVIQRDDATGLCLVSEKHNEGSDLLQGDVILSMNGILMTDVDAEEGENGQVSAWVKVFEAFAARERTVLVSRPAPMQSADDGNKIVAANPMTAEGIARMDNDLSTMLWADMRGGNAYKVGIHIWH